MEGPVVQGVVAGVVHDAISNGGWAFMSVDGDVWNIRIGRS
jgi:hypothetical protein